MLSKRSVCDYNSLSRVRHRALDAWNEAVRRMARERPGIFLADFERLFERAVPDRIPDDRLFLDNCHPRPLAHRLMAGELYRVLEKAGLLRRATGDGTRSIPPGRRRPGG